MAKEKVFVVVGLGTFGRRVCEVLTEKGGKVIAIDQDASLVEKIKNEVTQAVLLDSTDEESLSRVPLEDCDFAVVAIGDNIEASILSTALLKKAGVPYILSRAVTDIHGRVLKQVGADEVVNIEIDEGTRIAQQLISPEVLDRVPLSKKMSMAEVYVQRSFWGKTLQELDLRRHASVNVVAIRRTTRSVDEMGNPVSNEEIIFPDASTDLKESDVLMVVGGDDDIDAFKEM